MVFLKATRKKCCLTSKMIDDTNAYTDQVMLSMIARETAYHATTDEQRHQEGLLECIQGAQIDRGQSGRRCCTYGEE